MMTFDSVDGGVRPLFLVIQSKIGHLIIEVCFLIEFHKF